MKNNFFIRMARPEDAGGLLAIYTPYVENTGVTFETTVPSLAEFEARVTSTLATYPWLVAEQDGIPIGYAYAGPMRTRAAYSWSVETTAYVSLGNRSHGVGGALYGELLTLLTSQHFTKAYACVASSNEHSITFHEGFGYTVAGRFSHCGFKNGIWQDIVWMEKTLAEPVIPPDPIVPLKDFISA